MKHDPCPQRLQSSGRDRCVNKSLKLGRESFWVVDKDRRLYKEVTFELSLKGWNEVYWKVGNVKKRNSEKSKNHLCSWSINREEAVPNKTVRVCWSQVVKPLYTLLKTEEREWVLRIDGRPFVLQNFRGTGTSHLLESNLSHVGSEKTSVWMRIGG